MKKLLISALIIMLAVCVLASACDKPIIDDPVIDNLTANNEAIEAIKTAFEANVTAVMANKGISEDVKNIYIVDYSVVHIAQADELIYYAIISLYNNKIVDFSKYSDMQNLNINKSGDKYDISYKDSQNGKTVTVTVESKQNTSRMEVAENGVFMYMSEKIIISDNEYAMQYCGAIGDGKFNVGQIYVKGLNGRLSVDNDAVSKPASIFNNASAVDSKFATGGDRCYVMTAADFTYSVPDYVETKYDVTFEENGGTAVTDLNTSVISGSPETTRTGYTFAGWFTKSDLSGNAITFPYTVTANITLYAKWIDNSAAKFNVTFEENGGTAVTDLTASVIANNPVTTKTDWIFAGWFTKSDLSGNAITFPYTVTANITLYAKWTQNTAAKFNVTFEENGGTAVNDLTAVSEIATLPVTTKTGFVFNGWFANSGCTGNVISFPYTVYENTTLYAKWIAEDPYAVRLMTGYYNSLNGFENDSFVYGNMSNPILSDPLNEAYKERGDFYRGTVQDVLAGLWSAPLTLADCAEVIKSYNAGTLSDNYSVTENFGKIPSVVFDSVNKTYELKYWMKKGLYSYWFEVSVAYNDTKNTLKATVKTGVDAQQAFNNYIEIKKISDTAYMSIIKQPEDSNKPDAEQNLFKINTAGLNGTFSEIKFVTPEQMIDIFNGNTVTNEQITSGDIKFEIASGNVTLINSLISHTYNFFNKYVTYETALSNAIDTDNNSGNVYYYVYSQYQLQGDNYQYFEEIMNIIKAKEEKFVYQCPAEYTFSENNGTYTLVDTQYGVTATMKKLSDKVMKFTAVDTYGTFEIEIYIDGAIYALQKHYVTKDGLENYEATILSQDGGNTYLSKSINVAFTSYSNAALPSTFAKDGNEYKYTYINHVFSETVV